MDARSDAMDGTISPASGAASEGDCPCCSAFTRKKPLATAGARTRTATATDTLDITVLLGGPSSEREVSLVSGRFVADALERRGHRVTRSDISPNDVSALDRAGIDVVFVALHGEFGESGDVQDLCENRRLRYIGSPPNASRQAMDKAASKTIFRRAGLPTADWVVLMQASAAAQQSEVVKLGLPVVVKPVNGGSSVDVTIAKNATQRDAAIADCLAKYGHVMVEQFIGGKELTVGILGQQALPIIQIVPAGEFYDYHAKYSDDAGTKYLFDHGIDDATVAAIQKTAIAAHASLGCRDLSRVDFLLDESGAFYILEINTIPGFTSHSLLPMAARKAGIEFDDLVNRIARMAMRRV